MIAIAYLGFFLTALVLAVAFTWAVRHQAVKHHLFRRDSNARHIHSEEIPRFGGVAIYLAFHVSLILVVGGFYLFGKDPGFFTTVLQKILPAAGLVFILGLVDDIYDVRPWMKFGVQTVAAFILYSEGLGVRQLTYFTGDLYFRTSIGLALTILWVVGITNAFNLIDGLDGLAAGSALFSTVAVFIVALLSGSDAVAMITVGLAASILGFLRFNFSPATIFLGDSGSLFVGFMLSAIGLAGVQKSPTLVAVAIPVVACGLPILDTMVAIARRVLSGKSIFGADREHIHHKLLDRGLTQRQVVILLYGVSALCAFLSLFLLYPGRGPIAVVIAVLGIGAWVGLQQLDYREISELKRLARRTVDQKRIIANNIAVHRACEGLAQASSVDDVIATLRNLFENNDFDGFELHLTAGSDHHHLWKRDGFIHDSQTWQLIIPLFSGDKVECGRLVLYRGYSLLPLLIDINLLTSNFPVCMGDALVRAGQRSNMATSNT